MALRLFPGLTLREANAFVAQHHAHHGPARGCKFVAGALDGERLCGVVIVERPKARLLDDGFTLELSRVCTDRTRHVASMLIAAAARAAFALGARKVISYVLESEDGTSYRAAGWTVVEGETSHSWGAWDRSDRARAEPMADLLGLKPKHPQGPKQRWEKVAA